jgi:hypothetical protein
MKTSGTLKKIIDVLRGDNALSLREEKFSPLEPEIVPDRVIPKNLPDFNIQLPDLSKIFKGAMLGLLPRPLIKSYVSGINTLIDELSSIKPKDVKDATGPIYSLGRALEGFQNFSLVRSMITLTKFKIFLKTFNRIFANIGTDYTKFAKVSKNFAQPLTNISNAFLKFGEIKWIKTLAGAKALDLTIKIITKIPTVGLAKVGNALKLFATKIEEPLRIFTDFLKNTTGSLLKGAIAFGVFALSLIPLSIGLKKLQDIEWSSIGKAAVTLGAFVGVSRLLGKNMVSSLKGAASIAILGASLIPLAYGLKMFNDVNWRAVGIGATALGGLALTAGILGIPKVAGAVALGAGVIALLGASLIPFAYALNEIAKVDPKTLLELVPGLLGLAASGAALALAAPGFLLAGLGLLPFSAGVYALSSAVSLGGDNLLEFLNTFSDVSKRIDSGNLYSTAGAIAALSGSIAAFAAANVVDGIGNLVGKLLRLGSDSPIEQFERFAEISNPLRVASAAIDTLADGIAKLNGLEAEIKVLANFPFDQLEDLAEEIEGKAVIQIVTGGTGTEGTASVQSEGKNGSTTSSLKFDKMSNEEKAGAAGYSSWEDYKNSGWKWKGKTEETASLSQPSIDSTGISDRFASSQNNTGDMLNQASTNVAMTPIIVNNYGGNTTNNTSSSVNNNTTSFDPIMTGSNLNLMRA